MMIHLSLGLMAGLRKGQAGPGPVPAHTAVLTELLRDQAIFDSGFQRGLSTASVPLSGTTDAPDGAVIEMRLVDVETPGATNTTAWAAFATASGGAFAGAFPAPRAPCWYRAEVRVQGSGAPASQMANRLASGHVWSLWEQSNWARLVSDIPGAAASLYDPVAMPGDVQISYRGTLGTMVPVTEANKNAPPVTPAMVTLANAWSALRPGEKLALVFNAKSGTSFWDAMTRDPSESPSGTRDWDEERTLHETAVNIGTQVGTAFIPGWIESHIGLAANIPDQFLGAFTGHDAAGSKIAIATLFGNANVPRIPPAVLADGSTADKAGTVLNDPANGGLYDLRYTRACWFGPHGNDVALSWLQPASTYASLAAMPSYDTVPEATSVAGMVTKAKAGWDAALFPEVLTYPGQSSGGYRASTDTLHMDGGDRDGRQRHAAIGLYLMTKALGLHSYAVPVLDGRRDDPAGAYTDFWISGRNLTTERLRRAAAGTLGAIPATIPAIAPHRCEVMGWAINKRPVLAAIQTASGHPVLPDGQTFCRVYANAGSPITPTSEIRYGYGPLPAYLVYEDYDDRVYLNWLVCDMGQPQAVLPALPVQFQQNEGLPSTLAAPDLFKVAGTTYMRSTAGAVPPGTTAYMEARFRVDVFSGAGMELMGLGNDAYVFVSPNGSVALTGNGSAVASTPAGTLVAGAFRTLGFVVDRTPVASGGTPSYRIIDVDAGGAQLASGTPSATGAFSSGRVNFFFRGGSGNAPFNGTFQYARTWQNTPAPAGNPAYAVEALAASPHYAAPYGTLQLSGSATNVPPTDGIL